MCEQQTVASELLDEQSAQHQINQVMMATFCRTLVSTHLPPIVVMRMIAAALGKAYADVATAHRDGRCTCGWRPSPPTDLELLRSALAHAGISGGGLMSMTIAGHA